LDTTVALAKSWAKKPFHFLLEKRKFAKKTNMGMGITFLNLHFRPTLIWKKEILATNLRESATLPLKKHYRAPLNNNIQFYVPFSGKRKEEGSFLS